MRHNAPRSTGPELDLRSLHRIPTGAALTTGDRHRLIERNKAFRELFGGWKPGLDVGDALPGSRFAPLRGALDRARHEERPTVPADPLITTVEPGSEDQSVRACVVSCTPVVARQGPAVLILATPLPDTGTDTGTDSGTDTAGREARQALRRYETLLAASRQIVWRMALDGELSLLALNPADPTGRLWYPGSRQTWLDAVHPKDRPRLSREWQAAVADPALFEALVRVREQDPPDRYRHVQITAAPVLREGTLLEWIGTTRDAEEQWWARTRERMLARMAQAPTAHDLSEVFVAAAAAVVPELVDAFAVFLLRRPDELSSAAPPAAGYATTSGRTSLAPGLPPIPPLKDGFELGPLAQSAIGAGRARRLVFPEGRPPDDLVSGLSGEWMRQARATSLTLIPVVIDGEPVALASAATCNGNPPPSESELALLEEVLDRMAGPLRRTMEHQSVRATALALQRALLIAPPAVTGAELAASYRPASSTAEIGGDWYDALGLADGAVTLTIGDIAGHDLAAATAMSQLHSMLRGIIFDCTAQESPARSLSRLDSVVQGLDIAPLVTAVHATLRRGRTGGWNAVLSNAGHPPPLLVPASSPPRYLYTPNGADPPLCVAPGLARTDWNVRLAPGDTLLLYTDGLVEVPGQDITDGLRQFARHTGAAHARALPLADLIDDLVTRVEDQRDDIAVIGFRATAP
ncbi:SpoIIE family protein phosphatase [Streptomyces sp. NPDC059894]|uniref:SpoIIE family protein phosphatase n=1 Tax=unclassified Streptomyces TaxID=2593676 RepID=UPI00364D4C65